MTVISILFLLVITEVLQSQEFMKIIPVVFLMAGLLSFEQAGLLSAVIFIIFIFENFMVLLSDVTFSAFSRVNQDYSVIQRGVNKFLRFSSLFIIPYFVILETIGDTLVRYILGEIWIPRQGVFQILAWIVLILPFGHLGTAVLKSLGASKALVIVNFARICTFLLVSFLLMPSMGLIGLSIGIIMQYCLLFGLLVPLRNRFSFFKNIVASYKNPVISALSMGIWLILLRSWIHGVFTLIFATFTGVTIFYLGLYILERKTFIADIQELFGMITGKKH